MIGKIGVSASVLRLIVIMIMTAMAASCNRAHDKHRHVAAEPAHQPLLRFEQALFTDRDSLTGDDVAALRESYGLFFDLFCRRILQVPDTTDAVTAIALSRFAADPDLNMLKRMADSLYAGFSDVHDQLNGAFGLYRHFFPAKPLPVFITCLSAFNYQVITADSVLAISLDMYLGADRHDMYASIGFPRYKTRRFCKPFIAVDCMKGWYQSEYDVDSVKNDLISKMLYYGKMLYFLDCTLPGIDDSLKCGFTAAQLAWCKANESNIWAHFIEQNLLFSTDQQTYFRYINDGPTTTGLPEESPAMLGQWVGWQIVRSWALRNPDVPLTDLFRETDAQKLLNASKYKPPA